jgi:hypothetical protein
MNQKIVGVILFSIAGLIAAIGAVGAQIANAIVQGHFMRAGWAARFHPDHHNRSKVLPAKREKRTGPR